eukprot:15480474-Alexandrium_andersonii.AAC.1
MFARILLLASKLRSDPLRRAVLGKQKLVLAARGPGAANAALPAANFQTLPRCQALVQGIVFGRA